MGLVERFASLPLKYVLIIVAIVKFGLIVCLCSLDYCTSADPEPVPQLFEFIMKEHSYFRHLTLNMHWFFILFLSYYSNMFLLRCSCLNNYREYCGPPKSATRLSWLTHLSGSAAVRAPLLEVQKGRVNTFCVPFISR